MTICPGHKQLSPFVLGELDNLIGARSYQARFDPTIGPHFVSRQVQHDIIDVMTRGLSRMPMAHNRRVTTAR